MLYQIEDWDDAYANGIHIPDGDRYLDIWPRDAAAFRTAHPPETLGKGHMFRPMGTARGLVVFIHGGWWIRFDPTFWSHFAAGALAQGWAVAIPGYTLAPAARIADITAEVAQAVTEAAAIIDGPIVLTGHSAGGHLAARMICPGVLPDDVAGRVARCLPISALTDLRPLMRLTVNESLRLDAEECATESPALLIPRDDIPVTVWVGGMERPEFIRHSRILADLWAGFGVATELVVDPGRHHFDVLDGLTQPESPITRRLLGLP